MFVKEQKNERNKRLFSPLATKEFVKQNLVGTKLYHFSLTIWDHFYSAVFKTLVNELSSTLILNANEWETLLIGEPAEVEGALPREDKQNVPHHNTGASQGQNNGKVHHGAELFEN